jgi:hypothetical protein
MVLSIAAGEPLDNELEKFVSSVSVLLKQGNKEHMQPHWFIGGMLSMVQLFMPNLFFIRTKTASSRNLRGTEHSAW